MTRKVEKCGASATMVVYSGANAEQVEAERSGKPMCSKHGTMLIEDAGATYSVLRPSDPPALCEFWEAR